MGKSGTLKMISGIQINGKIAGYPQCCIDYFESNKVHCLERFKKFPNHSLLGTGFVPCPKCMELTSNMTRKQIAEWLGRDIFNVSINHKLLKRVSK
jgi:hypothetical protein